MYSIEDIQAMAQRGLDDYEIALTVLEATAQYAEDEGCSVIAHCGSVAGILATECGLDEGDVEAALEDVLFEGAV